MHTDDSSPLEVLASRLEAARSNINSAEDAAKRGEWLEVDHFIDKAGTKLMHASDVAQELDTPEPRDARRFLPGWPKIGPGGAS